MSYSSSLHVGKLPSLNRCFSIQCPKWGPIGQPKPSTYPQQPLGQPLQQRWNYMNFPTILSKLHDLASWYGHICKQPKRSLAPSSNPGNHKPLMTQWRNISLRTITTYSEAGPFPLYLLKPFNRECLICCKRSKNNVQITLSTSNLDPQSIQQFNKFNENIREAYASTGPTIKKFL
ncbi:hypothetical protein AMTRI_Chr08g166310 [Amborella trichopoda]